MWLEGVRRERGGQIEGGPAKGSGWKVAVGGLDYNRLPTGYP